MILVKRRLAIGWLVLTGLAGLFLIVGWLTLATGETFWMMAKALSADIAMASPAIRYLRRTPADRRKLRELEETDRKLDAIERGEL